MDTNKRIECLDIARGIGIFLVVLGHCVVKSDLIHKYIFSFHMPLFFIISGYCFNVKKFNSYSSILEAKGKRLLVPFIALWGMGLIISLMVPEWRSEITIKGLLVDLYLGYPRLSNNTSIWFLISLFLVTIIYYSIYKIEQKYNIRWLLPVCNIGGCVLGYGIYLLKIWAGNNVSPSTGVGFLPGGRLPLTLDASLMAFVFFSIGREFRNKKYIIRANKIKTLVLAGVTYICSICINPRVNMHACSYGNLLVFMIAALSGTGMIICIAKLLEGANNIFGIGVKRLFAFYGRNSLFMFGTQSLFIHLGLYFINRLTESKYILYENVPTQYGMIIFLGVMWICLPVSFYMYRIVRKVSDE